LADYSRDFATPMTGAWAWRFSRSFVFRFAFSEPKPPAIIVDYDGNVIGIV
jgi:hypothetical protein